MPFPRNSIAERFRAVAYQAPTNPYRRAGCLTSPGEWRALAIAATQLKQLLLPKATPNSSRNTDETSS